MYCHATSVTNGHRELQNLLLELVDSKIIIKHKSGLNFISNDIFQFYTFLLLVSEFCVACAIC